ncbi:hypothetical protein [Dactylosporangium darangshiense]|uniref:hypothetical protein n=1 Tax=Dactylosporangium darangshiense TaxID=579108 RepID=UPI00363933E5
MLAALSVGGCLRAATFSTVLFVFRPAQFSCRGQLLFLRTRVLTQGVVDPPDLLASQVSPSAWRAGQLRSVELARLCVGSGLRQQRRSLK